MLPLRSLSRRFAAPALVAALVAVLVAPAAAVATATCFVGEPTDGFVSLYDGSPGSIDRWRQSGPGRMVPQEDCSLKTEGGLGLFWYADRAFQAYTLRLEWRTEKVVDNAGVFVGFPAPGNDPFLAVNKGYEVQIDNVGRPDAAPQHQTGAIYNFQGADTQAVYSNLDPTGWNLYEITVDNPKITVALNGVVVNEFTSVSTARDLSVPTYVGLQEHGGEDVTYYRNVQIKEIEPTGGPTQPGVLTGPLEKLRDNVGIWQDPVKGANFDGGCCSYSALALRHAGVGGGSSVVADGLAYTWPSTASGEPDNVTGRKQRVLVDVPRGATKLGFLGASTNGPIRRTFTFNYDGQDAEGRPVEVAVPVELEFSDWTLNAGGRQPAAGNTRAITTAFRTVSPGTVERVNTYVFSITTAIDPTMRLRSITFPNDGNIHVFDIAAA